MIIGSIITGQLINTSQSLKSEPLSLSDLKEADCVTYYLTQRMLDCGSPVVFEELVTGLHQGKSMGEEEGEESQGMMVSAHSNGLRFLFTGLDGVEMELCPGGRERPVE